MRKMSKPVKREPTRAHPIPMPAAVPDDKDEWFVGPSVELDELVKDAIEVIRRELAKLVGLPEKLVELEELLEETEVQTPAEQVARLPKHIIPQPPQLPRSVRVEAQYPTQFINPGGHDMLSKSDKY
jgi:hypothetical protein